MLGRYYFCISENLYIHVTISAIHSDRLKLEENILRDALALNTLLFRPFPRPFFFVVIVLHLFACPFLDFLNWTFFAMTICLDIFLTISRDIFVPSWGPWNIITQVLMVHYAAFYFYNDFFSGSSRFVRLVLSFSTTPINLCQSCSNIQKWHQY